MITIPQILLILLILGLFITMFYDCFNSTKGTVSISNLRAHLNLLKIKFVNHMPENPEEERSVMECLQNKVKTSCSQEVISGNADLNALFFVICNSVNGMIKTGAPINKTQWIKYGALMNNFNHQYFSARTSGELLPQ